VPICNVCWAEIPAPGEPACACCGDAAGNAVDGAREANLCRACRLSPPPFVRAVAFGAYRGRMKDAIHAFKYDRLHPAARGLGCMLAQAIVQLAGEAPVELLVVPVPLHRSKHAQRGFNQARALAREALGSLAKSHPAWRLTLAPSALMRLRATESQAGLTPRLRRLNVRGAFSVSHPAAVNGKDILLVDDILTTGATARAAAQALRKAGASSVYVATLARARRQGFFRIHTARDTEGQFLMAGPQEQISEEQMPAANNHVELIGEVFESSEPISSQKQRSFLHRSF
jgi:ComF family protein